VRRLFLVVVLVVSCRFAPKVPSGGVACGAGGECPGDLRCDLSVRRCCTGGQCAGGCNVTEASSCGATRTCRATCAGGSVSTACGAAGELPRGATCAGEAACGQGLFCSAVLCGDASTVNTCKKYCRSSADCDGGTCVALGCGTVFSDAVSVCTNPCDPRPGAARTCPAGSACQLSSGDTTDCRCPGQGTVDEGGSCDESRTCKQGFICTPDNGFGTCRPICRMDDAASCGSDHRCAPVPGYTRFGGCLAGMPTLACDPTAVGSCPGTQVCRVICSGPGLSRSYCAGAAGTRKPGEICTDTPDCGAGMICISNGCPNGTEVRYCENYCKIDADCGANAACDPISCTNLPSAFGSCTRPCDPLANTGCATGLHCTVLSGDQTECLCGAGGKNGVDGSPCEEPADCGPGLLCAHRGGPSLCRPLCRPGGSDCAAGRTCVDLPDHRAYGACAPATDPPPVCEPTLATSCPTAGEGCHTGCAGDRGALLCQPAGALKVLDRCNIYSDCEPGTDCLANTCADGIDRNYCARHCKTDADCGGGSSHCRLPNCGGPTVPYGRCTPQCDPRTPATSGCPDGLNCYLFPREITDCRCRIGTQTGVDGAKCNDSFSCIPGLTCVQEFDRLVCRPLCRLDRSDCSGGRTCHALADQRIFGACSP
jgi:hypothetical protein